MDKVEIKQLAGGMYDVSNFCVTKFAGLCGSINEQKGQENQEYKDFFIILKNPFVISQRAMILPF